MLKGHDNSYNEPNQYYQKIFTCKLQEAKLQFNEDNWNKEIQAAEYDKEEDDEWSSYGQTYDWRHTESREWFEDLSNDEQRESIELNVILKKFSNDYALDV